jgi:hypothetical protein
VTYSPRARTTSRDYRIRRTSINRSNINNVHIPELPLKDLDTTQILEPEVISRIDNSNYTSIESPRSITITHESQMKKHRKLGIPREKRLENMLDVLIKRNEKNFSTCKGSP